MKQLWISKVAACAPIGAVGGAHDNDVGARLQAIHECEQLRDNAALHLTLHQHTNLHPVAAALSSKHYLSSAVISYKLKH